MPCHQSLALADESLRQNRCVKFKVQIPKSTKSGAAQATPAATALIIDVVGDDVIDVRD